MTIRPYAPMPCPAPGSRTRHQPQRPLSGQDLGPLPAHPGHQERGDTLAGNQTTGLVQLVSLPFLPFLPTVCAFPKSSYSNKTATTLKGLHQLAIVGSLHLCAVSKINGKPKEAREQHKVQIG